MNILHQPRGRTRHSLLRLTPLAVSALILGCWGTAFAGPAPEAWPFEWRPNWIPGDPPGNARLEAPWIVFAPPTPGLLVALDPISRLPIRPSAAQRAAAAAALEAGGLGFAPDGALPAERIPSGGELVHLQGRFQIFAVARRGADGRLTTTCGEPQREEK